MPYVVEISVVQILPNRAYKAKFSNIRYFTNTAAQSSHYKH